MPEETLQVLESPWDELPRVLILEDDPTLREILSELLEDEGYQVEIAEAGKIALEKVLQASFDLLIFDIRMEGMDGLETLSRMRLSGARFPCLAITGFAGDDDPIRALKLGVGDYLRKPFKPEQLLDSVNRLLLKSRQEQQEAAHLERLQSLTSWCCQQLTNDPEILRYLGRLHSLASASERGVQETCQLLWSGLVQCLLKDAAFPPMLSSSQRQLLQLARLSLSATSVSELAQRLATHHPGEYDPILLAALDGLATQSTAASGRDWLHLAQIHLSRGESKAAERALESAAQSDSPEAVDACLTLAELNSEAAEQARGWISRGVEKSRQIGPLTAARAMRRGAMLLSRMAAPEADSALSLAGQRMQELGLEGEAALLRLARLEEVQEALELLLQPQFEALLAPEIDTLFPRLTNHLSEKHLRRLLLRFPWLGRKYPEQIPDLLQSVDDSQAVLRLCSFGGVQLFWEGQPVSEELWRGPMIKYLFAFLAHQPAQTAFHENQLLGAFWPEGQENSKRRLSGALSALRRTLTQATGRHQDPILRSRDRYRLHPDWCLWHDLWDFEALRKAAEESRERDPEAALAAWSQMQSLYAGAYLEGCYLEWALLERQRIEGILVDSLLKMAHLTLDRQPERSLESAHKALGFDPYLQPAHLSLMKAWLRLAQPEKAISQFEKMAQMLQRELQIEPSLELLEAYHRARLALP